MGLSLLSLLLTFVGCGRGNPHPHHDVREAIRDIPPEQRARLEAFFSRLVRNSGAAYTLFGPKPWSVECFPHWPTTFNTFRLYNPGESLALQLGWETWKQYQHLFSNDTYSIHCVPLGHPLVDCSYIVVINKPATLQVIQRHLSQFQKRVETDATPNELLAKIVSSEEALSKCIDSELLGILLGYGSQNSQGFDRRHQIGEYHRSQLTPPSFPDDMESLSPNSRFFLSLYRADSVRKQAKPSPLPGFESLADELNHYCSGMSADRLGGAEQLIELCMPPVFVAFGNDPETTEWLEAYAKTRAKLPDLLGEGSILEAVFSRWLSGVADVLPITQKATVTTAP